MFSPLITRKEFYIKYEMHLVAIYNIFLVFLKTEPFIILFVF